MTSSQTSLPSLKGGGSAFLERVRGRWFALAANPSSPRVHKIADRESEELRTMAHLREDHPR